MLPYLSPITGSQAPKVYELVIWGLDTVFWYNSLESLTHPSIVPIISKNFVIDSIQPPLSLLINWVLRIYYLSGTGSSCLPASSLWVVGFAMSIFRRVRNCKCCEILKRGRYIILSLIDFCLVFYTYLDIHLHRLRIHSLQNSIRNEPCALPLFSETWIVFIALFSETFWGVP